MTLPLKSMALWNQRAARLVPFLLVIVLGLQLAQLTWLLLPVPPSPPPAPVVVEVAQTQTEQIPAMEAVLKSLLRFNPWERPLPTEVAPPPPPPPPPPKEETAVVTELALDLIGTMVLPADASWAIMVRRSNRNQQISLRLGEEVDGATLELIERHAVFLRNHGRLEKLTMAGKEDKKVDKVPEKATAGSGTTLSKQSYEQLLAKGMGVLSGVNITPFYQGANSVGYQLKFAEDNADMRQFGLVSGDVIQKVNGISVLDQKKAADFAPQLKSQSALRIDVIRNNRPETIQLQIGP